MITEKFLEVLKNEGVVSIVSMGEEEPHIVNTWNSYIVLTPDDKILIPAYAMRKTEKNVHQKNKVKLALGSREVMGYKDYQGTGFVVEGTARFLDSGDDYDRMKAQFSFLTRVMEVTITSLKQML